MKSWNNCFWKRFAYTENFGDNYGSVNGNNVGVNYGTVFGNNYVKNNGIVLGKVYEKKTPMEIIIGSK